MFTNATLPKLHYFRLFFAIVFVGILLQRGPVNAQDPAPKAVFVFGQPDFNSNDPNHNSPVDATSLNFPLGLVVDERGGFYVADRNNNRVLYFANDNNNTADRVYGQFGSFNTNVKNNDGSGNSGEPSADNLSMPSAVTLDSQGGLYIDDRDNHRVLYFANDGNTTADRVYGQLGSFTTNPINNDGAGGSGQPSADNMGLYSLGLAVDKDGGLYLSDSSNFRILYFANDGNTTADRVYGQHGNFTTNVKNNDGNGNSGLPSADNLNFPRGLVIDDSGGFYVGDRDNHRVLYFANDGNTTADRVYGQSGNFTWGAWNNSGNGNTLNGAPNAENLKAPRGVALDSAGGLYVADHDNNRVLFFDNDGDTKADWVFGQNGNFNMAASNNGGNNTTKLPGDSTLSGPQYVAVGIDGRIFISDTSNHRVLVIQK
jgi:hypothetical protein